MTTTVEIKAQFIRSIPQEGVYRLQLDIIDVVNIDFDVLVFNTEHDTYSRVATVYDLETYPVGKAAAGTANAAYYRGRGAQLNYLTIRDATGFEFITRDRLKILAVAYASIVDAFSGTSYANITSTVTP
jgi:hypothetical protein